MTDSWIETKSSFATCPLCHHTRGPHPIFYPKKYWLSSSGSSSKFFWQVSQQTTGIVPYSHCHLAKLTLISGNFVTSPCMAGVGDCSFEGFIFNLFIGILLPSNISSIFLSLGSSTNRPWPPTGYCKNKDTFKSKLSLGSCLKIHIQPMNYLSALHEGKRMLLFSDPGRKKTCYRNTMKWLQ